MVLCSEEERQALESQGKLGEDSRPQLIARLIARASRDTSVNIYRISMDLHNIIQILVII